MQGAFEHACGRGVTDHIWSCNWPSVEQGKVQKLQSWLHLRSLSRSCVRLRRAPVNCVCEETARCCVDRFVCRVFRSPNDYSMKFYPHCAAMGSLTCGQTHTSECIHTVTHRSEKSEEPVNDCRGRRGARLWWCQGFVTDAGCKMPCSQVYCYEKK